MTKTIEEIREAIIIICAGEDVIQHCGNEQILKRLIGKDHADKILAIEIGGEVFCDCQMLKDFKEQCRCTPYPNGCHAMGRISRPKTVRDKLMEGM